MWWKRNAVLVRPSTSGSTSCLSVERAEARVEAGSHALRRRVPRPRRSTNTWPITDGGLDHRRSSGVEASRRAASRAWIVGGTSMSARSPRRATRRPSTLRSPSSIEHREHLLDEQRVALGRVDDRAGCSSSSSAPRAGSRRPAASRRRRAARARSTASAASHHSGCALEELVPRRAHDEEQRRVAACSTRCSTRSRNVGSAQWMSSKTTTSGRRARAPRGACARPRRAPRPGTASRRGRSPTRRGRRRRRPSRRAPRASPRAVGRVVARAISAACRAPISASGQNVMPSPYGRQRPRRTRAPRRRRGG